MSANPKAPEKFVPDAEKNAMDSKLACVRLNKLGATMGISLDQVFFPFVL